MVVTPRGWAFVRAMLECWEFGEVEAMGGSGMGFSDMFIVSEGVDATGKTTQRSRKSKWKGSLVSFDEAGVCDGCC